MGREPLVLVCGGVCLGGTRDAKLTPALGTGGRLQDDAAAAGPGKRYGAASEDCT